jgi:hypothetical protein
MNYTFTSLRNTENKLHMTRTTKGFEITEQRVGVDGKQFTHPIFFSIGLETCIQDWNKVCSVKAILVSKDSQSALVEISGIKFTV